MSVSGNGLHHRRPRWARNLVRACGIAAVFLLVVAAVSVATAASESNPRIQGAAGVSGHTAVASGYWLVASDGGVFAYGDARFYGSTGSLHLNEPIVGMAATPDGEGYWLVASDGGIFAFGDAGFYGSTGGHPPQQAHRGHGRHPRRRGLLAGGLRRRHLRLRRRRASTAPPAASTSTSPSSAWPPRRTARATGWWPPTAASSPSATPHFYGSTGGIHPQQAHRGHGRRRPTASGYWLVASDGGIFAFGDARFYGSTGGIHLNEPIVGMAATSDGGGYWLVASDGGIFAFGDAAFYGSTGAMPPQRAHRRHGDGWRQSRHTAHRRCRQSRHAGRSGRSGRSGRRHCSAPAVFGTGHVV